MNTTEFQNCGNHGNNIRILQNTTESDDQRIEGSISQVGTVGLLQRITQLVQILKNLGHDYYKIPELWEYYKNHGNIARILHNQMII